MGARRVREAAALAEFRRVVLERAGLRCERCGAKPKHVRDLHAHHVVRRSKMPGVHDPTLGKAVCVRCHLAIHLGEAEPEWLRRAP